MSPSFPNYPGHQHHRSYSSRFYDDHDAAAVSSSPTAAADPVTTDAQRHRRGTRTIPPTSQQPEDDATASAPPIPLSQHTSPPGMEEDDDDDDSLDEDETEEEDEEDEDPSQTVKVRAVISGWKAGTIIGRQGAVINALRHDSNCKITMSDDPANPDRMLSVIGHPRSVSSVLRRVCFLLSTAPSSNPAASAPAATAARGPTNKPEEPSELTSIHFTLAVPSPLCGCLIGRKGAQIRAFRQRFDVAFTVSSSPILESLDRPVTISGPPENVANCLREVCRLLAQSTPGGPTATASQDAAPGPTTGTGGGGFRYQWKRTVSGADVYVHDQPTTVSAETRPRHRAGRRGSGAVATGRPSAAGGPYRRSGGGSSSGRPAVTDENTATSEELNSIRECSFDLESGETEVHLLVPNDIVGCIIGRAGRTISEIRETSGAFISITDGAFPPPTPSNAVTTFFPSSSQRPSQTRAGGSRRDRTILIRGASKSVRTARYLMGSSILNAQRGVAPLGPLISADTDL